MLTIGLFLQENCKRKVAEIKSMRAEMQGMADNIRAQEVT